ncbi:hypothetical protein M431DRAFT_481612 [Trichoderma harzianum CBS 226.95]|uniref:C2H2-type domain-containing protein n=1 Tax=Trichoderma harzianum CBS 226.95 TaxID=983964 RepID=A0A2T4AGL7_TRIHA|nr:hypothetical protein M431DRAFT_481612 [Trichoderma harzianum CBS 226.95]PTB56173.1 hypothetical protein M431DRAFT_481612 [Trichoderma harzianum CBS 226.95]
MEPKIAPLVNRCLALFETFSESLSSSQAECSTTRSHLARFRLWAGSLGAHRSSGGRSLEYRLRDSSFVRNHIISLLQELVSSIDEGIELANTESDDKKALDDADLDLELYFQSDDADEQSEITNILGDIGHIIDCLLRLSITIRNPARHDQFNSRAGADTVSSYSEWDMKHIREKFDRLDGKLVDRLAMAMSRRRQYIKYREEHSKKLAHGLLDEPGEGENATTIASSIPKKLKDEENTAIFTKMDALLDNMSEVSGTSYANSIAANNELRVPSIPREYIDGPFLCPICHTLIIINDRNSWKDLQPYVCLFDNCSSPSQVYQRRKDWVAHMKQEHWVSWSCSFGCSKSFRSQESFEEHVTTIHGQNFESIDLQAVLNLCRFPNDTNTVGICPFCFDYEIKSDKSYQSHVGDNLERLALFVLPKTLYDDDSDGGDDDSDIETQSRGGDSWENEEPDEGNIESTHPLMDYNMQLELLEQANKKRLMRARQEQSEMEGIPRDGQPSVPAGFDGQPFPDTSPQARRSGTSPNPEEQMNNSSIPSHIPGDDQSLEAPNAMDFLGNHVEVDMAPHLYKGADEGNMEQAQMNSMNLSGKKVSFAKGKNIAMFPSTTLKYREDSPDSHPDSQDSAMRHSAGAGAGSPLLSLSFQQETLPPSTLIDRFFFGEDEEDLDADISSPGRLPPPSDTGDSSLKRSTSITPASPKGEHPGDSQRPESHQEQFESSEQIRTTGEEDHSRPSTRQSERFVEEEFSTFAGVDEDFFKPSLLQRHMAETDSLRDQARGVGVNNVRQRYGSLSTFHGEGPIETSPISALRAVELPGSDTIVPRPHDHSEYEDATEESKRLEEHLGEHFKEEVQEVPMYGDSIKPPYGIPEFKKRRGKDAADAAEKMRRLEGEFRDEAELRDLQKQLDAIKERESNAEIERRVSNKFALRRFMEEEDAAEAAERKRRLERDSSGDEERRMRRLLEEFERTFGKQEEEAAEEKHRHEKEYRDEM